MHAALSLDDLVGHPRLVLPQIRRGTPPTRQKKINRNRPPHQRTILLPGGVENGLGGVKRSSVEKQLFDA